MRQLRGVPRARRGSSLRLSAGLSGGQLTRRDDGLVRALPHALELAHHMPVGVERQGRCVAQLVGDHPPDLLLGLPAARRQGATRVRAGIARPIGCREGPAWSRRGRAQQPLPAHPLIPTPSAPLRTPSRPVPPKSTHRPQARTRAAPESLTAKTPHSITHTVAPPCAIGIYESIEYAGAALRL